MAEVRTNKNCDVPNEQHVRYGSNLLGDVEIFRIAFLEGPHEIVIKGDTLDIGLRSAAHWIARRVRWMYQNLALFEGGAAGPSVRTTSRTSIPCGSSAF